MTAYARWLAEEVRLTPLTYDETALVTTLILGTGLPAPREVVGAVFARTDGIPLHIEELLAALGDAERSDGRAIRDAHVPETIEDAVLARYARLSRDAQAVARACAGIREPAPGGRLRWPHCIPLPAGGRRPGRQAPQNRWR